MGEKLRRRGRRYGNERNKNALAHNVAKGVAEVGKYAANCLNHNVDVKKGTNRPSKAWKENFWQ